MAVLRRLLASALVASGPVVLALTGCGGKSGQDIRAVDCTAVKCVALTFDDGPTPYTDRLLKVLGDADAKATFFVIGNKVAANPAFKSGRLVE